MPRKYPDGHRDPWTGQAWSKQVDHLCHLHHGWLSILKSLDLSIRWTLAFRKSIATMTSFTFKGMKHNLGQFNKRQVLFVIFQSPLVPINGLQDYVFRYKSGMDRSRLYSERWIHNWLWMRFQAQKLLPSPSPFRTFWQQVEWHWQNPNNIIFDANISGERRISRSKLLWTGATGSRL